MLTNDQLTEIEKRAEAATPGPWKKQPIYFDEDSPHNKIANVRGVRLIGPYKSVSCGEEAEFIAHSRTDIPLLTKEIRMLREQNETLVNQFVEMWNTLKSITEDDCDNSHDLIAEKSIAVCEKIQARYESGEK